MFMPSTAVIKVKRREPAIQRIEEALEIAQRRNRLITEKVVTSDLLKSKPKSKAKSAAKIAKEWERDKRLDAISDFIKSFNKWRKFYAEIDYEWVPKTTGQITCIENIMEMCDERDVSLSLFIACQFKALEWKKATPSVQQMQAHGGDRFNENIDDVLEDIRQVRIGESGLE